MVWFVVKRSIAAIAGFYMYFCAIDKLHGGFLLIEKKGRINAKALIRPFLNVELLNRVNADLALVAAFPLELDLTSNLSEKGIILTDANIVARVEVRTTLANENAAGGYDSALMLLDAQTLGFAVATVTGAGYAFLMSKKLKIKFNQGGSPPVTFFRKGITP